MSRRAPHDLAPLAATLPTTHPTRITLGLLGAYVPTIDAELDTMEARTLARLRARQEFPTMPKPPGPEAHEEPFFTPTHTPRPALEALRRDLAMARAERDANREYAITIAARKDGGRW